MGGRKKIFLELAGVPVLLRSLRPFLKLPAVVSVVGALPEDDSDVEKAGRLPQAGQMGGSRIASASFSHRSATTFASSSETRG